MPNNRYINSARRELEIKKHFEDLGWYAIRASGSHGVADVIAIRPVITTDNLFEVKFIQVKTSQNIEEKKVVIKEQQISDNLKIQVEWWYFPVKNKKYWEKFKKSPHGDSE